MWRRPARVAPVLIVSALVVTWPMLGHPYPLVTYAVLLATSGVVLSLSFIMNYVGEISLGHGALVTVGAFTTAILLRDQPGLPFVIVIVVSCAASAALGGVVAWLTLRMSGLYLAIATMTLVYVVTEVALQLRGLTGGATGVSVRVNDIGLPIEGDRGVYYLAAACFGVLAVAITVALHSRVGYYWVAIRDALGAAEAFGVPSRVHRIIGFVVSSAMAGTSGAVLAVVVSHVGPFDFGLAWSFTLIVGAVVGGRSIVSGALIGGAFITLVPVALSSSSGKTDGIFGATLVMLMFTAPGGLPSLFGQLSARWRRVTPVAVSPSASSVDVGVAR